MIGRRYIRALVIAIVGVAMLALPSTVAWAMTTQTLTTTAHMNGTQVPSLLTPTGGAIVGPTPTLTARHFDPEGENAQSMTFEVCSTSACGASAVQSGTVNTTIAAGGNGSWPVPTALAPGTWYWHAKVVDARGDDSGYSTPGSFVVSSDTSGPTIVLGFGSTVPSLVKFIAGGVPEVWIANSTAGDFTVTPTTLTDASGVASVSYPTILGSTITGGGTVLNASPWSQLYNWGSGASNPTTDPVNVIATDTLGNSSTASFRVRVDTTPPTGGGITQPSGTSNNISPTLTISNTATDPETGISKTLVKRRSSPLINNNCTSWGSFGDPGGTPVINPPASWTDTTITADGCYEYQVLYFNGVGLSRTVTAAGTIKIDRVAPNTVTIDPVANPVGGVPAVSGTVSDDATRASTVAVSYDDGPGPNDGTACSAALVRDGEWSCAWDTRVGIPDGAYTVSITATDAAGNTSTVLNSRVLQVDNSAPSSTLTLSEQAPGTDSHVSGSTAWYRPAGSGAIDASVNSTDPSGVANVKFDNPPAPWTGGGSSASNPALSTYTWSGLTAGSSVPGTLNYHPQDLANVFDGLTWQAISATSDTTAYVASGNGRQLLRTTNGGSSWLPSGTASGGASYRGIDVFGTTIVAVGDGGIVGRSTNGLVNVTETTSGTANLRDVNAGDLNNWWAVGDGGTILKSNDGGVNWNAQSSGTPDNLFAVDALDANTIWAGGANGTITWSANGGGTWSTGFIGSTTVRGIAAATTSKVFVVGANGFIRYTNDGGSNWLTPSAIPTTATLRAVVPITTNDVWAAGDNVLLHSIDGGGTWMLVDDQLHGTDLYGLSAPSGAIWAAGAYGRATLSTNGGTTFLPRTSYVTHNVGTGNFQILEDTAGPTSVSISSPATLQSSSPISVTYAKGGDGSGSGVAGFVVKRQTGTLTSGSCGSWTGAWNAVVPAASEPSPYLDGSVVDGACYQYQIVSTDNVGNATTITASQQTPFDRRPTSGTAPSVPTSAAFSDVLTVTPGTWTPAGSTSTWQWQLCTPGCANIAGATTTTYTVQGPDVGYAIRVVETATNVFGSTSIASAPTNTVTWGETTPPTVLPAIDPSSNPQYQYVIPASPPGILAPKVWLNGNQGGQFTVRSMPNDTGSGVAGVDFLAVTGAVSGGGLTVTNSPDYSTTFTWGASASTAAASGTFTARDVAGNSATGSFQYQFDSDPPSASIPDPAAYRSTLDVPLSPSSSDAGSGLATTVIERENATLVSTDSCGAFANLMQITPSGGSDLGVATATCYRYRVVATDKVGNVTTTPWTAPVLVDTTAPTGTIAALPGYRTGNVTITGTADDLESGIDYVDVTYDGPDADNLNDGAWCAAPPLTAGAWSCTQDTSTWADGTYELRLIAYDNVGHPSAVITRPLVLDNHAPTITGVTLGEVSGQAWQYASNCADPCTPTVFFNPAATGSFSITVSGTDGGSGIASAAFDDIDGAANGWSPAGATVNGPSPISQTFAWTAGATSSAGLQARLTDAAGLSSTHAFAVTADATAPTGLTIGNPPATVTTTSVPVTYSVASASDGSGSGVAVGSEYVERESATLSSPGTCGSFSGWGTVTLTSGNDNTVVNGMCYHYRLRMLDNVGNLGSSAVSGNVLVDTTAPSATVTPLPGFRRGSVTVSGTAGDAESDLASISLDYDGPDADSVSDGPWCTDAPGLVLAGSTWSCTRDTSGLADGTYQLRFVATNSAGTSTSTITQTLLLDNAAPTITQLTLTPQSGGQYAVPCTQPCTPKLYYSPLVAGSVDITIDGTDSGGAGITSATYPDIDGVASGWTPAGATASGTAPYTRTFSWAVGAGANTGLVVQLTDGAGGTATAPFQVTPDSTAPTGMTIADPPAYVTSASVPVTYSLAAATDGAGSGIAAGSAYVERQQATLGSDDTCSGWGGWTSPTITGGNDATVTSGSCYRYRVSLLDRVGNTGSSATSSEVHVDTALPGGSFTPAVSPAAGTITFAGTASDTLTGVTNVEVAFRNGPTPDADACASATLTPTGPTSFSWTCSWDTVATSIADGTYDVLAIASDRAGNAKTFTQTIVVDNTGPNVTSTTITPVTGAAWQSVVAGSTPRVWVNPAQTGSFQVTVAGTGIDSASFPTLGTGWTGGGGPVNAAPFAATYGFAATPSEPGTVVLPVSDAAGNGSTTTIDVRLDSAAPTGGSITSTSGVGTLATVTFAAGTDSQSGVAASHLERRTTGRVGASSCDTANWTSWTQVGTANPSSPFTDGSPIRNTCHEYRLLVDDKVGNTATYTSASTFLTDGPGIVIAETGGSTATVEHGATDTYTVALKVPPTQDVHVAVSGDAQVSAAPNDLVFNAANWSTPQTVTVTAVDDPVDEVPDVQPATLTMASSSSDAGYAGLSASVAASATDNDVAGYDVIADAAPTVVEGSASATEVVKVRLTSRPVADVAIAVAGDVEVRSSDSSLTFSPANWDTPQAVTISAVDDTIAEPTPHTGKVSFGATSADPLYGALAGRSLNVAVRDNDPARFQTTAGAGWTENADGDLRLAETDEPTAKLNIRALGDPTRDIVITPIVSEDIEVSPAYQKIEGGSHAQLVTFTFHAIDDHVAEPAQEAGRIVWRITTNDALYDSATIAPQNVVIADGVAASSGGSSGDTGGSTTPTPVAPQPDPTPTPTDPTPTSPTPSPDGGDPDGTTVGDDGSAAGGEDGSDSGSSTHRSSGTRGEKPDAPVTKAVKTWAKHHPVAASAAASAGGTALLAAKPLALAGKGLAGHGFNMPNGVDKLRRVFRKKQKKPHFLRRLFRKQRRRDEDEDEWDDDDLDFLDIWPGDRAA